MSKKFKLLLVYANLPMDNVIPVGVSSLIASLRPAGIEMKLFDTTFYRTRDQTSDEARVELLQVPPFSYADLGAAFKESRWQDDFTELLEEYQPNLVGVSLVEPTYELGLEILALAKQYQCPTITGGIFAILNPELLIANELIDMVCIGEGEKCLPEVCHKLGGGDPLDEVKNLWSKRDGKIIRNDRELLDIETLPPLDFKEYAPERFYRPMGGEIFTMVPAEFARGCPFNCSYCADPAIAELYADQGKWFRKKSIATIITEIEHYVATYQPSYFYFIADSFLALPLEEMREFADGYKKIKIPFWLNTRPETITEEKIKLLKEIGCHRMSIGIENGNEEFRAKVLRRYVSNEKMLAACQIVHDFAIPFSLNNIIGFPGETREIIFDTIALNRKIKTESIGAYIFMPYRGTDIYNYCVREGYIAADHLSGDCHVDGGLLNNTISPEELQGLLRTFSLYVNMPEEYYPEIRKAEEYDVAGNQAFAELSAIYRKEIWGLAE